LLNQRYVTDWDARSRKIGPRIGAPVRNATSALPAASTNCGEPSRLFATPSASGSKFFVAGAWRRLRESMLNEPGRPALETGSVEPSE